MECALHSGTYNQSLVDDGPAFAEYEVMRPIVDTCPRTWASPANIAQYGWIKVQQEVKVLYMYYTLCLTSAGRP